MQCLKRCVAALLAAAAGLAGVAAAAVVLAPRWLNDADAPEKSAAIVVLGGDASRALEAADLYRAGYAPRIYVSAPVRDPREQRLDAVGVAAPREEELARRALLARGVPESAIELLARDMTSTAQEARAAADRLAGAPGPVLVVTSPYHLRRARMIFRHALPGRELRFLGNRYEPLPDAWWTDQAAARNVVLELAKTAYYLAGGRF